MDVPYLTAIQAKINQQKEDLPLTDQIPKEYHQYLDIFDEVKAERFPESQPWDHKIELKEGFQPKSFKTYNGITLLLCQKERWEAATLSRLLISK